MRRTSCPSVVMQQQIGQRRGATADRIQEISQKEARLHFAVGLRRTKKIIYMICVFIPIARMSQQRGMTFFDRRILGG